MSAPSATQTATSTETAATEAGSIILSSEANLILNTTFEEGASYPAYLPYYGDHKPSPPLEIYDYVDPGSRANKDKINLLNNAKIVHLNPYIGTVIENVQISELSNAGLDELALLVAERKLLVFRDQDFKDIPATRQTEIAGHFGRLHVHPMASAVKDHLEQIVVYRDAKYNPFKQYTGGNKLSPLLWHSDVSFENQTPSTTFFWILDQPEVGGDTLFLSQVEAYNRLSPDFKKLLVGLKAVHSGVSQADFARKSGIPLIREPVESEHPIVRVHPVTGEKALFVNEGFTKHIVGFKDEESKALLGFLYNHIAKGADFQTRATYKPGTVIIWDNRVVLHSSVPDFDSNIRRHAIRLTPQGEIPIPATEA
ncbi:hypothetical protein M422DRAFT_240355 [Sphaerobolus stellatus SS14]|nr:hypothetical protein M422DRAFT_240355 [Sphaerobolus stellatus SS14]